MRLHSSSPPMSGKFQSIMTTAGWCFANRSRASRPFLANNAAYRSAERLLDEFAIDRRIINRENLERLGSRAHVFPTVRDLSAIRL